MSPTPVSASADADNTSEPMTSNRGQLSLQEMHKQKWLDMQGPPRDAAFTGVFSSAPQDPLRALELGDVHKVALQRRNEMERESEYAEFDAGNSGIAEPSAPSGHYAGASDGNMELYSGSVAHRGNIEQRIQAVPAAKKKTRSGLQPWEADSDSENEFKKSTAATDEVATADWNPFATHAVLDAEEQAGSRTRGPVPAELPWRKIGSSEQKMPEELKSREEQVLGIRPPGETPRRNVQAIGNLSARSKTKGDDGASEVEEEQGIRDAREVARRESYGLVELETSKNWQASPANSWRPGEEYGTLVGNHHEALAFLDTNTVADFDVEAEVKIEQGSYGGLLFRWSGKGIYALCIDLQKKQLQFHNPLSIDPCVGVEHDVSKNFRTDTWYRLRVRAADDTLMFFLDNKQVDQFVGYRRNDYVYYCDMSEKACVLDANQNGTYRIKLEEEDEKSGVPGSDLKPLPGCIGLFANQSQVTIRNVVMINLQEYVSALKYQQHKMTEERGMMKLKDRDSKAALKRRSMAARLIQEVGKLKNGLLGQRMEMYKQAETQGREEQLREKKLLTWMALLNVLSKINEEMKDPPKQGRHNEKFLRELDAECPPPPPPPQRPPPSKEEEELHYRYEEMKLKYEHQWDRAGKKVLGKEKFEKVKNMQSDKDDNTAFAFKQRKVQAGRCLDNAINSMSEKDHYEWLRKAWCFEHEILEGDLESQKEEMEQWYLEKVEERKQRKQTEKIGKNM